ncbi:MAG: vanillate O-demethylase oxidoreductase VanB, partial [Hyphomicrobiales bacterium]|nr:vanillate O-demethylase oxidoreductase VanB [Hyphomicrobiales bacterium]
SGFDHVPAARRDEAFRMNDRGWEEQIKNIARYLG